MVVPLPVQPTTTIDPNVAVQIFAAVLAFATGIGVWWLESRRQEKKAESEAREARANYRRTLLSCIDQTQQQLTILRMSIIGKNAEIERCGSEPNIALNNSIRDLADQAYIGIPPIYSATEAHARFFNFEELKEISNLAFQLVILNHRLDVLRRDAATIVSVVLIREHLDAVGRIANLAQDSVSALLRMMTGAPPNGAAHTVDFPG